MLQLEASTQVEARLRTAALRLKSALAAAEVISAGRRVLALLGKANFDPNQPRVPRGEPDGGRWTRAEAWRSGRSRQQLAANESPPKIPRNEPPRASLRWPVVKLVARWAFRLGVRATPVGRVLDVIQAAQWIYDYAPYIQAYLDEPKPLDELQRAASERKTGYDIHHIVEKTPALADGFSWEPVDGPENLVRVPTLQHWRIAAWFATKNDDYGGLSPRDYLRGKSWDERRQVGLVGMTKAGVLKP